MSLDVDFGPCQAARGNISPAEMQHSPESLQVLDQSSGAQLRAYMGTVAGLSIPQIIHNYCVVLWLVDEEGTILFALEELIHAIDGTLVAVRPRGDWGNIPNTVKLGHPSLLQDPQKRARIGGEIRFDRERNLWEINNYSGRYGTRAHQTLSHLQNVAQKFNEIAGIVLEPEFG